MGKHKKYMPEFKIWSGKLNLDSVCSQNGQPVV